MIDQNFQSQIGLVLPCYLLITPGYLVITSGYVVLVVTSGYLIATTSYLSLLLAPCFNNNVLLTGKPQSFEHARSYNMGIT